MLLIVNSPFRKLILLFMFWNEVELKLLYEIHLVLDVCSFGHV
jgi:hypothetical protein